jgi:hypothetical protein
VRRGLGRGARVDLVLAGKTRLVESAVVKLPRQWPAFAQLSFLNALAMARMVIMQLPGWCADSPLARVRLAGERDAAVAQVALLTEEARILRTKLAAIDPRRRPQHSPTERMAILALRAHGAGPRRRPRDGSS